MIRDLHQQAQSALSRRDYQRTHQCCLQILKTTPGFADAWFMLGMIAADHGQVLKARELFGKSLLHDPDNPEYLTQTAKCDVLLNRHVNGVKLADRALKRELKSPQLLDTLGVCYSQIGLHHKAVYCFNLAVKSQPDNAGYQFNLATALKFIGQMDKAIEALKKCLDLSPAHAGAHYTLSDLAPGSVAIERLIEYFANADTAKDKSALGHALAREYEHKKDFLQATKCLTMAKQANFAERHYDFDDDRCLFNALKQPVALSNPGFPSDEPIFVVGMPRTGTTVVERILSNHAQVTSIGETQHFAKLVKQMSGVPSGNIIDAATIAACSELDFAALGKRYIESTRALSGQTARFVDKMPLNALYAGLIHRALPNARIICLDRNPLDTIVSNFRQPFGANEGYYDYSSDWHTAAKYYESFNELMAYWQSTLPERFYRISYEALVNAPEKEGKKLFDFCRLDWHRDCLDIGANSQPVATASAAQVRKAISNRSVGQWRNYGAFIPGDIVQTHEQCSP